MNIPIWTKPAIWGVVCGALAMLAVGLSTGWLVTNGTATQAADDKAEKAVIAALTPLCVAEFKKISDSQKVQHFAALEEESSWQQGDYIADHGWATLPSQEEPNEEVAEACAEQLLAAAPSEE